MSDLKSALEKLAADFVAAAVAAIQHASLGDIAGLAGARQTAATAPRTPRASTATRVARRGRRRRRTAADIGKVTSEIAALLAQHKGGLRAEQLRAELGIPRNELPRPIAEGLKSGKFKKRGKKRATVYFVGTGARAAKSTPGARPAGKKRRAKTKRRAAKRPARKIVAKKTVKRAARKPRVASVANTPQPTTAAPAST